jgi:YVTN family beta-propeller protein
MKKVLFLLVMVLLTWHSKAQIVSFTDVNFKAAVIARGVDTSGDGNIQNSEAQAVTNLDVQSYGITEMTGISSFTNLQTLNCSGNSLMSLNLTGLSSLQSLSCSNNAITNLDVSSCTALTNLSFNGNPIAVFNASDCTLLSTINGYSGYSNSHNFYIATLTNLNLTNCSSLQSLYLSGSNLLNSVQITGCTGLTSISLISNAILTSFTVSNLPNLTTFEAAYNPKLASLTFTDDTALNYLTCHENALTSLKLSGLPSLNFLSCRSNSLTSLNLNSLTTLRYLFCLNNNLASLDVSGLSSLYQLNCIGNSGLTCIKVADVSAANSNEAWTKDATAVYSTTCDAIVQLTVTKTGVGAGSVVSSPTGIDCGITCASAFPINTMITLAATPDATSIFVGWSGAVSSNSPTINVTMDAAKSINAQFDRAQFSLTISNLGGGTVSSSPAGIDCGSTCTANYYYGTTVQLTATPNPGATFAGWTGACTGTGPCTVNIDAAKTVTARFTYPLTISKSGTGNGTVISNPAGINCGATCIANYGANQMVTLTATSDTTSTFVGWTGAVYSNSATINVTMDAAKSINAEYNRLLYTLNVAISGSHFSEGTWHIGGRIISTPVGIDCPSVSCAAQYVVGTQVTIFATPNPGYTFSGWSGACTGTGPCVVNMNAARTVVATFVCVTPNTPSTIFGNTQVCQGATETYSVVNDPSASSYTWTLPSGWIGSSTTNSITVTTGSSGTLSVKANSICGSSSVNSELIVTVNSLPKDSNENQLSQITADANTIILDHFNSTTTGQLYGAMNYVTSMNGMGTAAEFKNNNWIRYNYNANLSSAGTIDFWIYAKAYNIPLANINWNTGATSYPGGGHVFHSRINAAGKIEVGAWPTGSFISNASIPLNTWTRITITWGSNNNIIYINGVTDVVNTNAFNPSANGNYSIYFPYWGTTSEFYLDELHVSNKKRTPQEINSVYQLFIDSEVNSICENTATHIRITNPETGISYQLFKENEPFGTPQIGVNNQLIFDTGNLNETTHFTIKATNPISGCSRMLSDTLTITVNPLPIVSVSQTNVLCSGASTGSITASVTGGTAPYNYVWTCPNTSPSIITIVAAIGNNPVATGLPAETYTITVTDSKGCSVSKTIVITQPTSIELTASKIDPVCYGSTGTINFSATGGTAKVAYITNSASNTVTVLNTVTNLPVTTITVGNTPHAVSVSPNGSFVYITNSDSNTVSVINTSTNTVVATIPVGNSPHQLRVTPDGSKVYVANAVSNNISVIDTTTNTVIVTIPVGDYPGGVAISPDGTKVYVGNRLGDSVSIINTATNTVSATIPGFYGPWGIAVSPDNSKYYVVCYEANSLKVVDASSNVTTATIAFDKSDPFDVVLNGDGSRVYVTRMYHRDIAVINTQTNSIMTYMGYVGHSTYVYGLSFDNSTNKLYITRSVGNVVQVFDASTNTLVSTITGFNNPASWGNFLGNVPGSTGTMSYTVNGVPQTSNTFTGPAGEYTIVATDANGCSATTTVNLVEPFLLVAPSQSFCTGAKVSNLVAQGTAIKWYLAATGGTALTATTLLTTKTYYVSQTVCGVESARVAVAVTVNPKSVAGTISAAGTICGGSTKILTISSSHVGTVQWQYSTESTITGFTDIAGATANSYTTNPLFTTTYFRAVVTSGVCSSAITPVITITVSSTAVAGTITSSDTDGYVCKYVAATSAGGTLVTNSTTLTLNNNIGLVSWYKSTNGGSTWSVITGQTATSLVVTNLIATTMFKAKSTSGACFEYSAPITINVYPVAKAGKITADSNGYTNVTKVCIGNDIIFTSTGQVGNIIEWQTSTTSATGPWTTVGDNATTYTMTNVQGANNSKIYVRTLTTSDATCTANAVASAVKTLTVTGVSVPGTLSGGKAICINEGGTLTLKGYTGLLQWMYSIDGGVTFSNVIGGTTVAPSIANTGFTTASSGKAATLVVTNVNQSVYFKVRVINGTCSTEYSNVQAFTLGDTIDGGIISGLNVVCSGTGTTLILTDAIGAIQWYKSPVTLSGEPTGVWIPLTGKTSSTLFTGNLTVSTAYKAMTTICTAIDESNAHIVLVDKNCVAKFDTQENTNSEFLFTAVAYPNPFNESFNLNVTTSRTENIGFAVYDMAGRLIEQREVNLNDVYEVQFGNNYPTGIYHIVVNQADEVKTLRVIKQ